MKYGIWSEFQHANCSKIPFIMLQNASSRMCMFGECFSVHIPDSCLLQILNENHMMSLKLSCQVPFTFMIKLFPSYFITKLELNCCLECNLVNDTCTY